MENTLLNMAMSLLVFCSIAALALATVYQATKEPIALVKQKKIEAAISDVLPEFDRIERKGVIPYDGGTDSLICYYAYKGEEFVGVAVETFTNSGFSGLVKIMVGFLPDMTIFNTAVLEHKETPGLGTKMGDDSFKLQFKDKNPSEFVLKVKKDGGDVDAITAATISSRAFCDAMDRAYQTVSAIKE